MQPKEYKCPKGSCNKILTERQFGLNMGYFCDSHGLVRTELYIPKTPTPAVETPPEPEPKEAIVDEPTVVAEEAPVKVKRTRKTKDSKQV